MLFGGFANDIFSFFIDCLSYVVDLVSGFIVSTIAPLVPDVIDDALGIMADYFVLLGSYINIGLSYLGFYPEFISIACLLLVGIILIPFSIHNIKLLIKWWNAIIP